MALTLHTPFLLTRNQDQVLSEAAHSQATQSLSCGHGHQPLQSHCHSESGTPEKQTLPKVLMLGVCYKTSPVAAHVACGPVALWSPLRSCLRFPSRNTAAQGRLRNLTAAGGYGGLVQHRPPRPFPAPNCQRTAQPGTEATLPPEASSSGFLCGLVTW